MNNSNKNTLNLQLVLLSFFLFITRLPGTKQDDDSSSPCSTPVTVEDAKAELQANGIAINKNYMAFTLAEAKLNFKNLITMEPMNFSSMVKQIVSPLGHVTRIERCYPQEVPQNQNFCTRCSAVTTLPNNIYPNTFNTIVCDPDTEFCGSGNQGKCTEFGEDQDLLKYDPTAPCDQRFKEEIYHLKLCCGCKLI